MMTAHFATKNAKRNGKNKVVKGKGTFRELSEYMGRNLHVFSHLLAQHDPTS